MKLIAIIALILSGIAVAIALTNSHSGASSAEGTTRDIEKELQQLEEKIRALEIAQSRPQDPGGPGASAGTGSMTVSEQPSADVSTSTQSELAKLKRSLDPYGVIEATENKIQNASVILMDESRSPWERAKQAELLKQYGLFDDGAVDAMRKLFATAESPNEKAAALVALRGHVTPAMRDEILTTLSTAVEEGKSGGRLTYHGIEALEPLLPDPVVESWLIDVAETDPEPKIAQRAATSLGAEIEWEAPLPKGR
jgi:hypothetical protein